MGEFVSLSLLQESVRWLASQGRIDECVDILTLIAKKNGKEVDDEVYNSFKVSWTRCMLNIFFQIMKLFQRMAQKQLENCEAGARKSWLDLFKTPRLRKNTILMVLTWYGQ